VKLISLSSILFFSLFGSFCNNQQNQSPGVYNNKIPMDSLETIYLGGGCFWCIEAIFQRLNGVSYVESGYAGGYTKNPTYKEVCSGNTGHAEVVKVVYNPQEISLSDILEVFFSVHDPTTLNRQGNDVGTQYRSAIYYVNEHQKEIILSFMDMLKKEKIFDKPLTTEVKPINIFYKAENYHQNYYNDNPNQPYCRFVIFPKIEKFEKKFSEKNKQKK
jgi:peptide-methionine (S)-S-oxide reductase